jgi:glycosyltransferase involved in cell wall biosynthesis
MISVIMPVYNNGDVVANTVKSLLAQTYGDFELLCINDCSPDNSLDVLRRLEKKDSRIKVYSNETNRGAGYCRNFGLELIKGDYCFFLDGDDYFEPEFLEKMHTKIVETDADVCFCNYTFVKTDGTKINTTGFAEKITVNPFSPQDFKQELFQLNHAVPWNKIYKVDFIKKTGYRFEELSSSNDLSFTLAVFSQAKKIAFVEDSLIRYSKGDATSTTMSLKDSHVDNVFKAYDALMRNISRLPHFNDLLPTFYTAITRSLNYRLGLKSNYNLHYQPELSTDENFLKYIKDNNLETELVNCYLKDLPLVTVILRIKDGHNLRLLAETIESLLNQSLSRMTIKVVNELSDVKSFNEASAVVEEYAGKDDRLEICNSSSDIDNVVNQVKSPFIFMAEAGELFEKETLLELFFSFIKSDADVVYCNFATLTGDVTDYKPASRLLKKYSYLNYAMARFPENLFASVSNKMYRTKVIIDNNIGFNDENSFIEAYARCIEKCREVKGTFVTETLNMRFDDSDYSYFNTAYEKISSSDQNCRVEADNTVQQSSCKTAVSGASTITSEVGKEVRAGVVAGEEHVLAPKVSVIIPIYNVVKLVRNTLRSVCNQTLRDIEIICVDDCSNDGSSDVLKLFTKIDNRIQVIALKENSSALIARKRGVLASHGEYVMFLDGDDEMMPTACEEAYNSIVKHQTDIVMFGTNVVNYRELCSAGRIRRFTGFIAPFEGEIKAELPSYETPESESGINNPSEVNEATENGRKVEDDNKISAVDSPYNAEKRKIRISDASSLEPVSASASVSASGYDSDSVTTTSILTSVSASGTPLCCNLLKTVFVDRAFSFNLWNKIYKGDICREVFALMPELRMPKANDVFAAVYILSKCRTYFGMNVPLYCYKLGSGVTALEKLSQSDFNILISSSVVSQYISRYLKSLSASAVTSLSPDLSSSVERMYGEIQNSIKHMLMSENVGKFISNTDNTNNSANFTELVKRWGYENVVKVLASKFWDDSRSVSLKIKDYLREHHEEYLMTHHGKASEKDQVKKNKIKNLAFYYRSIKNGGAQRVTQMLCNMLSEVKDDAGAYRYRIILITDGEAEDNEYPLNDNITRAYLPDKDETHAEAFGERFERWREIIKTHHIDAVVTGHWMDECVFWDMLAVKSMPGVRYIVHAHNFFAVPFLHRQGYKTVNNVLSVFENCDGVVNLSEYDRDFASLYTRYCRYIPNPVTIDPATAVNSKLDKNTICWVGRIAREKQPVDLIKVMAVIVASIPDARLTIVGSGDEKILKEMNTLARKYDIADNVDFVGFTTNVSRYYVNSSVFINTSRYEGFSQTFSESMTHGLPIVTYDMPWLTFIRNNKGIVTVEQGDYVNLARNVIDLLNDREKLQNLGKLAKENITAMAQIDLAKEWGSFLDGLCSQKSDKVIKSGRFQSDTDQTEESNINVNKFIIDKTIEFSQEYFNKKTEESIIRINRLKSDISNERESRLRLESATDELIDSMNSKILGTLKIQMK